MHYIPYGLPHIFEQTWKNLVIVALIVMVTIVVVDFIILPNLHLTPEEELIIEIIDVIAVIVLAIDLVHHYIRAPNKKTFLKENAFLILSFIPYFGAIRLLRILVALQPLGVFFKLMLHWKDFKQVIKKEVQLDAQLLRQKVLRTHGRIR